MRIRVNLWEQTKRNYRRYTVLVVLRTAITRLNDVQLKASFSDSKIAVKFERYFVYNNASIVFY